jgi:OOP family OmpA-OmpF porin
MKISKYSVAFSLVALIAAPQVWAGGDTDHGFYAGVGVGNGKPHIAAVAPNTLNKTSDTVYDVLLGYKFNRNFAVEGQYGGVGKVTTTAGGSAKADATSLAAVGILPVNDRFSFYGKAGYAHTKTSMSNFGVNGASRNAPTYGVGMQYRINPMWGVRLGWDRYGLKTGAGTKSNADVVSLNAIINF